MIWISISMFGLVSVRHSFDQMMFLKMISAKIRDELEMIAMILMFLTCWWLKSNHFLLLAVTFSATGLPWLTLRLLFQRRKRHFQAHFVNLLDGLILSLRAGKSLRDAIKSAAQSTLGYQAWMMREISTQLTLQKNESGPLLCEEMQKLIEICVEADKKGHRTIDSLKSLREQSRLLEYFRRRSRQLTVQIDLQANMALIIFVLLAFFLSYVRSFAVMWPWIGASAALLAVGILLIKRKKLWNSKI